MSHGQKIIEGLREAVAGNLGRVHIVNDSTGERETWVKETPLHRAAPDLLEALKECAEQLALLAKDPRDNPWVQQARAAIAKAENRS